MNNLNTQIQNYLFFCKSQKCLDKKTIKAYKIDLTQFSNVINNQTIPDISVEMLESFIAFLHKNYKPKTAKRKIASIKAFYHYLEYKNVISVNPFDKIHIKFREPVILPKTIPLHTLEQLFKTAYSCHKYSKSTYQYQKTLQDIAIIELLFSTGIRISELCSLKGTDVNLSDNTILIFGKGSKERRMIRKYASLAGIELHITPHMFRHTFATSLLESDVDIRYIQEMLGHCSINITEIYTHVTTAKQQDILRNKH